MLPPSGKRAAQNHPAADARADRCGRHGRPAAVGRRAGRAPPWPAWRPEMRPRLPQASPTARREERTHGPRHRAAPRSGRRRRSRSARGPSRQPQKRHSSPARRSDRRPRTRSSDTPIQRPRDRSVGSASDRPAGWVWNRWGSPAASAMVPRCFTLVRGRHGPRGSRRKAWSLAVSPTMISWAKLEWRESGAAASDAQTLRIQSLRIRPLT